MGDLPCPFETVRTLKNKHSLCKFCLPYNNPHTYNSGNLVCLIFWLGFLRCCCVYNPSRSTHHSENLNSSISIFECEHWQTLLTLCISTLSHLENEHDVLTYLNMHASISCKHLVALFLLKQISYRILWIENNPA